MSKTTILLAGLMLVGLIASPALAQTTVTFRDQHIGPDYTDPEGQDPTMSNFSHLIQYDLHHPDMYYRTARQHYDRYDGWSMPIPAGAPNYTTDLMEFDAMFGPDTSTYEESYVGQVPHGAVIHSAVITMWRTNWGVDAQNVGIHQVLDPDNLGHWGIHDTSIPEHQGGPCWFGAGWFTRDSIPGLEEHPELDVMWDLSGTEEDPTSFHDMLAAPEDVLDWWYSGIGMYSEDWTMTNMTQNWADCLALRQGFAMTADAGSGEMFGGNNDLFVRPTLVVSFTPSTAGDADKDLDVDFADAVALDAGFGTASGACWGDGDFDGDGDVDFADAVALDANFGTSPPVPEPMTLTLLGLGALALIRRRK